VDIPTISYWRSAKNSRNSWGNMCCLRSRQVSKNRDITQYLEIEISRYWVRCGFTVELPPTADPWIHLIFNCEMNSWVSQMNSSHMYLCWFSELLLLFIFSTSIYFRTCKELYKYKVLHFIYFIIFINA